MSAGRNGLWSVLQAAVPMLSSAALVVVVVRVLPVDQFGIYSYATTLVSLGVSLVTAGLSSIAIRELVARPEDQARTLAGLTGVRLSFAVLAYTTIFLVSLTAGASGSVAATLVAGVALFVRAADTPDLWYQSTYRARVPAAIRSINSTVWLGVKLAAAFFAPSLEIFLILFVLEFLSASIATYIRFWRLGVSPRMAWGGFSHAIGLLRLSWPLILSGIGSQLNTRADVPLVQALLGSTQQGFYSAAVKISEISYFLPNAFMQGTFPSFIEARKAHGPASREYRRIFQRSLDRSFWLGVLIAVSLAALSPLLVGLLYGEKYQAAVAVLAVHSIACPFVFMAAVGSKWLIAEGKLMASAWRHWAGAFLNICLNIVVIPSFGIVGAAAVAVLSYAFSSYLSFLCTKSTFAFGVQMTMAIVWPLRAVASAFRRGN